ncbi:MD-2-related lipid-recognition protein-like [Battus philenor]|uniref:MD-2-related lipid-recognition protein-like n=1 Tax=Battus philenor TaxID=42288 RepID=UPI0035CF424F
MQSTTFLLLSFLAVAFGTVVEFNKCENVPEDICTVSEVRISPCTNGKSCKLRKGKVHTISFDFVPSFATENLKTAVYLANPVEVPFAELSDANGCDYTSCPTAVGVSQELKYSLRLGMKLPKGKFPIKWKVWNEKNPDQLCCFTANIEIRK